MSLGAFSSFSFLSTWISGVTARVGPLSYPAHLDKNPTGSLPHHKKSPGCCHQELTGTCPALSLLPYRRMGIFIHEWCVCPQDILIRMSNLPPLGLRSPHSNGTLQLNRKRPQACLGNPKRHRDTGVIHTLIDSLHCTIAWTGLGDSEEEGM